MGLDVRRYLPAMLVAAFAVVLSVWNSFIGMTWTGPSTMLVAAATSPLLLLAIYTHLRGDRVISEICVFLYLYFLFPMLGVKLSYLATSLQFPLADDVFAHMDQVMGFSWVGWARFNDGHPMMKAVISLAYATPIAQGVASVIILGCWRNGQRNYETLVTLVLALIAVLCLYAIFPAIGPQAHMGVPTSFAVTIADIREGRVTALPYQGIVSFPSYHTVMAIVFTYAHRGLRYSFPPVLALNLVMLPGITNIGGHYLIDMFAGAAIAVLSILAAGAIYARPLQSARKMDEAFAVQAA